MYFNQLSYELESHYCIAVFILISFDGACQSLRLAVKSITDLGEQMVNKTYSSSFTANYYF